MSASHFLPEWLLKDSINPSVILAFLYYDKLTGILDPILPHSRNAVKIILDMSERCVYIMNLDLQNS